MAAQLWLRRTLSIVILLALILPPLPTGIGAAPVPAPELQKPRGSTGVYRTRIAVASPARWQRLQSLGVTILDRGGDWAVVLADEDQLETLARLRFEPTQSDEFGALVDANAARQPQLAAALRPQLDGLALAAQAGRRTKPTLTPDQQAAVATLTSVDDDGDGLTNTQEQWWCTLPLNPDSDGDGVSDGEEVRQAKLWLGNRRAGPPDSGKPFAGWPPQISGCRDDDQDSVPDLAERWELGLNPNRESTDRDKFDDGQELFGLTYCPGSGGFCGYGALPRNEDWGVIFAEMPSWVKAPGNHPFVAAFPMPEIDVVPSSLRVETVTTVTTDHTIGTGTERSYSTAKTEGTSTSVANTVTWNEWQEVSESLQQRVAAAAGSAGEPRLGEISAIGPAAGESENFWQKVSRWSTGGGRIIRGLGEAYSGCIPELETIHVGVELGVDISPGLLAPGRCLRGAGTGLESFGTGVSTLTQDGAQRAVPPNHYPEVKFQLENQIQVDNRVDVVLNQSFDTDNIVRAIEGTRYTYAQTGELLSQRLYEIAQVLAAPVRSTTETQGKSWGGAQTTTHSRYEEQTVTNGEAFSSNESWGNATAVNSAHVANLQFTYRVRNTGTEYAREIANLAFNVYLNDDPNPISTYFVAPQLGADGKLHNFMPGEEKTYTSLPIALSLQQMKAIDVDPACAILRATGQIPAGQTCPGGKIRIVAADFTYGIDELFYQDALNAGVLVAVDDGWDDGNELIDTYLIPTWADGDTVQDVIARYFPYNVDADGNVVAIWTPEYRTDAPAWCNERRPVGAAIWCKHAISTADWWNIYLNNLGDGTSALKETPAKPSSTVFFRFNRDTDLDGYSDRSEIRLGTNPNDPASHPKPELIGGVHSVASGSIVTATLSLLNTDLYDAYGVEAIMVAPDDSISITNNTVGGSGRVRAQRQVVVGSRIKVQEPLPAAWLQAGDARPAASGYYIGTVDHVYTFTALDTGTVPTGTVRLQWTDDTGASGIVSFGAGYRSPEPVDVVNGVKLAMLSGQITQGDSFTVQALTPRDTFQYTINRPDYTPPIVVVSYNDPQGNHRFVIPPEAMSLGHPADDLKAYSGKMLKDPGVEIVTTAPVAAGANTTSLVVHNPTDKTLVGAHLFLEFVDVSGTVASEVPVTVTLPGGPMVVPVTWSTGAFSPTFRADQDYIVLAFLTDYQGNILDTVGRPLSSFQADPKPSFAIGEPDLNWDFGTVQAGSVLTRTVTFGNTGYADLLTQLTDVVGQPAPAALIWTVAGTGVDGFSGDGGIAATAQFTTPYGMAIDGAGALYIADRYNNRVRRVASGIISTVAGNGSDAFSGDGGPATAAGVPAPEHLAVAADGTLYISASSRVRRVTPDGIISTIAGDGTQGFNGDGIPATGARLFGNTGLEVDRDGGLYIADFGNHRIRKIIPSGIITTVVGTGTAGYNGDGIQAITAQINYPVGIALGGDGTIYFTDAQNHRLRKVAPDGTISTVAGNGTTGLSGDGGPATAAQLGDWPYGIALSSDGTLYMADHSNFRVRRITPDGIISTVAGGGGSYDNGVPATSAYLPYPTDVAIAPDGVVYIVDSNQHRIRKISATSAEPGWIDQTPPGIVPHVGGVSALDANTVWAVGSARTILKTTNGGVTWAPQQPITGAGLTDVDVVDANTVWVVGDASPDSGCGDGETGCGLVLKTTDGGATWTARTFPRGYFPGSPHLTAVSAVDANTVWAVGFCGAVIKTVDGGANWLNLSGGCVYFSDVAAIDANTAWASAVSGVYKTTNGGASWSLVYPSAVALHSIAAVGPSVAWAVSQGGTIVKTIDGGANWITQTSGTTVTLGGITALDAANVWAVGENGTILRTADGGTHWVVQPSGTTLGLNGLTVVGPGTAWAVGGDGGTKGTILKCCVRPTTSTTAPGTANDLLWTTRASMPTRKDFFGAAVLNGKLFVVGGRNSDGALATVDEYDPAANTWSPRAPLPSARSHLALVAADNGKLYAIGGLDYVVGRVQGNATVATVDEYDPATNSWTTRASMPTSRAAMAVAVSNGRIFAIGGWSGPVPDNARPTPLAVVEEYDPSTNTWLARTPMPTPRYTLGAAVDPDGKLYAIGGSPDNVTSVATVEEYDPINNTWRNRAPMPTNRLGLGMAEASNGRLYAIGGSPGGAVLATVEEYDPSTNTWTTRASMPTARAGASAISMPNGSLYVVGGNDGYDYVATVEEATFVGGTRLVGTQANRILPGDTAAYTMAVDTRGSAPGTYARTLTFRTSDPARPTATVRVAGVITTTGPLTSTPGVSTLPDLAVSPADVAFGSPSPTEGETVPITATIQNGGGGDSGGLAVSFFATAAGWGETLIGSAFVTNVPARGTAQATIRWNTLGFVGSVPVRVVADPFRRVAESDEGNNSAAAGIAVRTRPDLSVAGIALSDAEPVDSQAVTVTLALPNTGQTTAVTHTVALYDGNPSAGGVPIGDVTLPPLPGGETRTVEVVWTPARLGAHRLFAVSDRANAVAESDEGNNQAWRDVAVGFRGPILVDSGTAADLAYTADRGYGYVDTGYTDERVSCGEAPHETLRRDPSGQVSYRFDHLQPGRFYHLNLTLYECSPAGRQETVEVDGNPVTGTVVLGGGQPQRLSLRLDPALYADRSITVSVKAPVIEGGAIVNEVKLSDVDYRYVDAGGGNDLAYTPARGYGYLDGIADPSVTTQTLPYQSFRVNQNGDTLRYQFDRLDPGRRYQVHLTFWQPAGTTARVQSVRINGADTGVVVDSGDNQPHRVTLDVPPSVYATSGSIVVGVVRSGGLAGPLVNEIALEERTDTTGLAELPTPTPTPTPTATTTATPTPTGSPTPSPTPTATPTTTGTAAPNEVLDVRQSNVTDVSFTLSFLSKLPAIAAVRYWVSGTTPSSAPVAEDFRTAPGETHRVRVPTSLDALDRLTPETAYRYTVHLDGALDPVYTGTVRTGPTLGGETPREAFGRVVALSGSPVGAALVYLTVERAGDQAASALLSAATDADGYWWIGLGGARTQDLAAPFSYSTADLARLEVTAGSAGAAAGSRAVGGPWPITLALQAVAQRSISLGFGWNAVALPLAPTEPISASQVAGLANGDGSTRMSGAFRFVSGLWQGGTYTGTAFVGDDFPLHPGEGYFFRMQSPFVWGLAGQPITGAVPLHLETGWNLVGAPAPAGLRARHLSDEAGTISDTTSYNVRQVARWILGGYEGHVSGYPFNNFPITDTAAYFVQATVSGTLVPGTSGYFPFDSVPALSAAGASARVAMAQRDAVLPSRRRWAAWRSFGQRRLSER